MQLKDLIDEKELNKATDRLTGNEYDGLSDKDKSGCKFKVIED